MSTLAFACACGQVQFETAGDPIITTACHCDDCQAGGQQLEALPGAPAVLDTWGGTAYLLYRKDRVRCARGIEHLRRLKLRDRSPTNRVVAGCCNTPMLVDFDSGPHWISVYRDRLGPAAPPLGSRVQVKFAPPDSPLPPDLPSYAGYPLSFVGKMIAARIAMLFG